DKEMPPSRKLKLCLLIIVDGVLLATTQNPKPTVKHVKRLESLKKFLGFQWGREAFWWTISGMLPPQRVLGKCDDPEGGFCKKLRQETKILPGFPLALQLWAFEAIPLLVKRLAGDDGETILTFSGAKLPQHSGLPLSGVLEAEHDPQLRVQPMVERRADEEEGWGEFDCEINDRKVAYVIELLNSGHLFRKEEWGGGDSLEPRYEHDTSGRTRKRKGQGFQSKEADGPALKQRRLSRYFTRVGSAEEGRLDALEAKVENLMELVAKLKRVVVKQGRQLRRRKGAGSGSSRLGSMGRKKKKAGSTEPKKLFSDSEGEPTDNKSEGGDDIAGEDTTMADGQSEPIGCEKGMGEMKESDVVPLEGADTGDPRKEGHQVYYGCGSNTFFVSEDEDFGELNRLVGVITSAEGEQAAKVEQDGVKEAGGAKEAGDAKDDKAMDDEGETADAVSTREKEVIEVADVGDDTSDEESESDEKDNDEDKVLDVSDSSPCKTTEKHKPVEREEELAALLLAKEGFSLDKLVPETEDSDYQFFESVLIASPKVYHMEALVDYVGSRHEGELRERRCLFLPPWFAAHLQGKTRAFNAAKCNKGRVLGDGRLSGFLTKEGKKWGEHVDTLYSPMIWGGNHWVGLCISLVDWRVLVLDPNPGLREMSEVWELMETVAKMLPYLVEKVCTPVKDKAYSMDPFAVERMGGAYENKRSGDCGPVSIKFMELHALGNPHPRMDGLTDRLVDIMRKQFAMDLYKDWVVPLYMGSHNE
ncbi:hypothetical protein N665_1341s0008, partial [Sinapis alba]